MLALAVATSAPAWGIEILSLRDAITRALHANHEQLALIDQVELAELDYATAKSAYKTKFLATSRSDARSGAELGSYSGVYLKKRNVSGSAMSAGLYNSDFGDKSLSELRFSYTLPFFRDQFSEGQLALTRADIEFVRRQNILKIAKQELSKQVTDAYYRLILAMDRERIAGSQQDIAERIRTATQIKYEGGKVSEIDFSRAEIRYLSAEQAQQLAQFQRQLAEDNLKLLIGMDIGQRISINTNPTIRFDESLLDKPIEELQESAVAHRIELQGKRDELAMTSRKLRNISDNKLPEIDIDVHYSLVGEGDDAQDSFDLNDQKWGVGFSMDTDFGGTERKSRRRKMYLLYQAHIRELEYLTQQIRIGVRTAQFEAVRNSRILDLSTQEYQVARRQHEQSLILHENDRLDSVELLESEQQLQEVEFQRLSARVSYILSTMELGLASGQYSALWN